jgi:two-component sensor histidine kinase
VEPGDSGREFSLVWDEKGGPPVQPPQYTGFGTTLIAKAMEYQHQGRAELIWRASGLLCRLRLPVSEITVAGMKQGAMRAPG